MTLATYQQHMLSLLKSTWSPGPEAEAYFHQLERSENLAMVKEIAVWWRTVLLEQYCPLTSGYLKRIDRYESLVEQFYLQQAVSAFIEKAGDQFLEFIGRQQDLDKIILQLAAFEKALLLTRKGSPEMHEFCWECDPYDVFYYALGGEDQVDLTPNACFRIRIGEKLVNFFEVSKVSQFWNSFI